MKLLVVVCFFFVCFVFEIHVLSTKCEDEC